MSLVKKCETMYLPSQIRMPAQMTNTMQVAGKLPTSLELSPSISSLVLYDPNHDASKPSRLDVSALYSSGRRRRVALLYPAVARHQLIPSPWQVIMPVVELVS